MPKRNRSLKQEISAIKASLAHVDLSSFREHYAGLNFAKDFDLDRWIPYNVRIVRELDLFDSKPITALDIGCGGGLLIYCLGYYGHRAVGTDRENQLFTDLAAALGVERRILPVERFQPLKPAGMFDLITVVSPGFDCNIQGAPIWGAEEWRYFLSPAGVARQIRFGFPLIRFGFQSAPDRISIRAETPSTRRGRRPSIRIGRLDELSGPSAKLKRNEP